MPSGPKTTKTLRDELLLKVASLDRAGLNQYEIARRVGVSQPCVCQYLKEVRRKYQAATQVNNVEAVAEIREGLRDVRAEAMMAWEQSKADSRKVVVESFPEKDCFRCKGTGKTGPEGKEEKECKFCKGSGKYKPDPKRTDTTEGKDPDPAYLGKVLETYKQERELLGLDAPVKVDVTGAIDHRVFPWDALASGEEPDVVEQRIKALLEGKGESNTEGPRVVQTETVDTVPPPSKNGHSKRKG